MGYWQGVSRWINTVLLLIVAFIGFDTLFRLLEANKNNAIVSFVRDVAAFLLAPFDGMFNDQSYLLTALIAVLGYCLVAAIILMIARSIESSIRDRVKQRSLVRERETTRASETSRAGETPPDSGATKTL